MDPSHLFDQTIQQLIHHFGEIEAESFEGSEISKLSMKQITYLEAISSLEKPTFSELARQLSVSKPSVTAIVTRLTQEGFVDRVQSAEDRRTFHILLTEKGRALQEVHHEFHRKIAQHFRQALTPVELDQLIHLLSKVVKTQHRDTEAQSKNEQMKQKSK